MVRLFSCLVERSRVTARVSLDGRAVPFEALPPPAVGDNALPPWPAEPAPPHFGRATQRVPLLRIAHGRSGDKGDSANIGIIARSDAAWHWLRGVLDAEAVAAYFAHRAHGPVQRYELPGMRAFNFVLQQALGGGGVASLRYDPQGKAYAQMLLDIELDVPADVLHSLG